MLTAECLTKETSRRDRSPETMAFVKSAPVRLPPAFSLVDASLSRSLWTPRREKSLAPERGTDSNALPISLRPYRSTDLTSVFRLLRILPALYPGGDAWLDQRLADTVEGRARCTLAEVSGALAGVTIETPKGRHVAKLSTIWVDPSLRDAGVGTRLMQAASERWWRNDMYEVYVTAALTRAPVVYALIGKFGFEPVTIEWDRYGPFRHEAIFRWRPR
jgi:N-acetylglutamate synthase-like GNAT family acetyltransferase